MSDWNFLHEMHEQGYSADEIADAAGSGAAPWEWERIDGDLTRQELSVTFHHIQAIRFSAHRSHPVFGINEPVRFRHI